MALERFEFLHQWSTSLAALGKTLVEKLGPDDRQSVEQILTLLDDNNHDLENFLAGNTMSVSGFANLIPHGIPSAGTRMRIDGDRIVLFPGRHISFTTPFDNGVMPIAVNAYNPLTTDQVIVEVDETTVTLEGYDVVVWVNGVIDTTYAPIVYWFAFGW